MLRIHDIGGKNGIEQLFLCQKWNGSVVSKPTS